MTLFTSLLLAFGLAMDAFAVAIASGSNSKKIRVIEALKLSLAFGIFQGVMPVIGWYIGSNFKDIVSSIDHWIAFTLLCIIGGKMIYDDFTSDEDEEETEESISFSALLVLAFATSIDALAVGFSLVFLHSILLPVVTIGLITFGLSLVGVYLGHTYKHFGKNKTRIIGGIILIAIGTKILIEHLMH